MIQSNSLLQEMLGLHSLLDEPTDTESINDLELLSLPEINDKSTKHLQVLLLEFYKKNSSHQEMCFLFTVLFREESDFRYAIMTEEEAVRVKESILKIEVFLVFSLKKNKPKEHFIQKYIEAANDYLLSKKKREALKKGALDVVRKKIGQQAEGKQTVGIE